MKLIVGLGNPGRQYANTRHNVGFRVLDELARRWTISLDRRRFSGRAGGGLLRGQRVLLLKPETYMNLSGGAVQEALAFHKLAARELLVITDDMALPLARLRIRARGSAGGHNGLLSIVSAVGTEDFARLRIGIDWAAGERMVGHVLSAFSAEEERQIGPAILRAADAAECWADEGVEGAMNRFNRAEDDGQPQLPPDGGNAS